jgi:hypothetical protein
MAMRLLGAITGFGIGFYFIGYGLAVLAISSWYIVGCTALYCLLAPPLAQCIDQEPLVKRPFLAIYLVLSAMIILMI